MIKYLSLLSLLCFGLVFGGCSTISQTSDASIAKYSVLVELAAYDASKIYLIDNPEKKQIFVDVVTNLDVLLSDNATLEKFLTITRNLPIKELKNDKTVIILDSVIILFGVYQPEIAKLTDLEQAKKLTPIIVALRNGLSRAVR